jgi:hypothetical protein
MLFIVNTQQGYLCELIKRDSDSMRMKRRGKVLLSAFMVGTYFPLTRPLRVISTCRFTLRLWAKSAYSLLCLSAVGNDYLWRFLSGHLCFNKAEFTKRENPTAFMPNFFDATNKSGGLYRGVMNDCPVVNSVDVHLGKRVR